MDTTLKDLEVMKKKLTDLGHERAKVEGMKDQLMEQLKAEGINSLEEGQAKVVEMKEQVTQIKAEAQELLSAFQEKYKLFL